MIEKDKIITDLYSSKEIDDIINNITKGDTLAQDLKSELFYILCSMSYDKLKAAKDGGYLIYLCINILKKQYNSSTSPFHKKYRNYNHNLEYNEEIQNESLTDVNLDFENMVLSEVNKVLETLNYIDRELFKIYYKMDEYDRWIGSKRDTNCEKNISSTRKIERKLAIQSLKGQKKLTIDHSTIALSLKNTLNIIKEHFKNINIEI